MYGELIICYVRVVRVNNNIKGGGSHATRIVHDSEKNTLSQISKTHEYKYGNLFRILRRVFLYFWISVRFALITAKGLISKRVWLNQPPHVHNELV